MKNILLYSILLNISLVIYYYVVNFISKEKKININIEEELNKQIRKLNLKTSLEILDEATPNYDLEKDKIQINMGNNIKVLSESFHELGHAFYNHFNFFKVYSNNKLIKYNYNEIDLNFKFMNLLEFLFTKGILLSLLFSLFGIFLEIKILMFLGIIFGLLSSILHINNLWEEIKATTIAKELISYEKYLNKKEKLISYICLNNALTTYLFVTLLSNLLIFINIYFIL